MGPLGSCNRPTCDCCDDNCYLIDKQKTVKFRIIIPRDQLFEGPVTWGKCFYRSSLKFVVLLEYVHRSVKRMSLSEKVALMAIPLCGHLCNFLAALGSLSTCIHCSAKFSPLLRLVFPDIKVFIQCIRYDWTQYWKQIQTTNLCSVKKLPFCTVALSCSLCSLIDNPWFFFLIIWF